jgi:hypothetical protein
MPRQHMPLAPERKVDAQGSGGALELEPAPVAIVMAPGAGGQEHAALGIARLVPESSSSPLPRMT